MIAMQCSLARRILCCLVFCLFFTTVQAQTEESVGYGFQIAGARINLPESVRSFYNSPGFGFGAHLDVPLSPLVSISIAGDYGSFILNADEYRRSLSSFFSQAVVSGGRLSIFSLVCAAKYRPYESSVVPYLVSGLGLASLSASDVTVLAGPPSDPRSSRAKKANIPTGTKGILSFGGGLEIVIPWAVFVEVKYQLVFTEGESSSFVPVSLGITF